jgi:hypothetical protein
MLAGRKETTRKLYRDAYEAFGRFAEDVGLDPTSDGWERLPPNGLNSSQPNDHHPHNGAILVSSGCSRPFRSR